MHCGASTFLVPAYTPGLTVEATHHLVGALPWEAGHLVRVRRRSRVRRMLGERADAALVRDVNLKWPRSIEHLCDVRGKVDRGGDGRSTWYASIGPNQKPGIWYGNTTNLAVTLPSTPADQGEQRRTVTNAYSQVAGIHE
jgi:hypothetical protein